MKISSPLLSVVALIAIPVLPGQDTRTVAEPRFPQACTVLAARLSAPNGVLPESAETMLDTARIQSAMDGCEPGKAVELRPAGAGAAGGPLLVAGDPAQDSTFVFNRCKLTAEPGAGNVWLGSHLR